MNYRFLRWVVLSGVAGIPSVAIAQSQDQNPNQVENVLITGSLISDITVPTDAGSRLGLSVLDTPASVDVISGDAIRLHGDLTVNDAVTRAPGITTNASVGAAGNTVAVRGFNGASVAYLYDGIRNDAGLSNVSWPYDPWTVDRIEVLNGPASVMFGAGGIGGSINVIPRLPSAIAEQTVRVSGGSFNTWKAALDSTGPITDQLLYRLDVSRQQSDGYIHDGKSESTAISGAFAYAVSSQLKFTLSDDYALIKPMNYNGLPLVNGVALKSLWEENYQTSDSDVYFKENNTRFNIDWTPSDTLSVRNITSLVLGDRLWKQGPTQLNYDPVGNDIIRGSYGSYAQQQNQWNNQTEARWSHPFDGHNNTLSFGGDVERLDFKRLVTTWPGVTSAVSLYNPDPGVYPTTGAVLNPAQKMQVWRYSLFAEDRFEITPDLSILGGIRYDHAAIDRNDLTTPPVITTASRTFTPINWRIGSVYEIFSKTNLYAQYSKATDLVSNYCCVSVAQLAFNPATGQQVEAGVKQSALNGRLEWTFSAYQIVKKDLLVPDPYNPTAQIQVGQQSSRGLELSASFNAGAGITLEANGTVLDPKFDDFQEVVGGVPVSRDGNRPTNVPSQSANLWATWAFHPDWLAQVGLRYVGKRYIDNANTQVMPAYTVIDATLHWAATDHLGVDFRVGNVFDAFYPYNFSSNGKGGGSWIMGAPRTYEIALTAGF